MHLYLPSNSFMKLLKQNKMVKASLGIMLAASLLTSTSTLALAQSADEQKAAVEASKEAEETLKFTGEASQYGAYLAARIALLDNNTNISTELFARALELDPQNSVLMRNLFLAQIADGKFDDGIDLAKKIISHSDLNLGESLIQLTEELLDNKMDAALKTVKTIEPANVDEYLHALLDVNEFKTPLINPIVFAAMAAKDNNDDKAKRELKSINDADLKLLNEITKGSQPFITEFALSVEAIKGRTYDSAIAKLSASHSTSNLDKLLAGVLTAWSQVGNKDTDAALETLNSLKGPKWFDPFITLHRGYILAQSGKTKEATLEFKRGVDDINGAQVADQAYSDTVVALANAYARNESWEDALVTIENGMSRFNGYALMKAVRQDILDKKKPALHISTPQQGAAEIFLNIGSAIDRDESVDIAQIYMQLAKTLAPKNDEITMELAQHYDREGATEKANEFYREIPEGSPFHRVAQLEIALNLDQLKKREESEALFNALIEEKPKDLVAYMAYGAIMARSENYKRAAEIYDAAVAQIDKKTPNHWNLFYRRGIAFERLKQWPKAEADFQTALKLYPDNPDVLNYLGYTWIDMGIHLDEGLKMILKAAEQRPTSGYIIDSLGWAYYKLGIYGKAAFHLERALELEPADPTINDHLGDAYWHISRKNEAKFQWNHALALDPDDELKQQVEMKLKKGLDAVEEKPLSKDDADKDEGIFDQQKKI